MKVREGMEARWAEFQAKVRAEGLRASGLTAAEQFAMNIEFLLAYGGAAPGHLDPVFFSVASFVDETMQPGNFGIDTMDQALQIFWEHGDAYAAWLPHWVASKAA